MGSDCIGSWSLLIFLPYTGVENPGEAYGYDIFDWVKLSEDWPMLCNGKVTGVLGLIAVRSDKEPETWNRVLSSKIGKDKTPPFCRPDLLRLCCTTGYKGCFTLWLSESELSETDSCPEIPPSWKSLATFLGCCGLARVSGITNLPEIEFNGSSIFRCKVFIIWSPNSF